jgi:hypothetical protein
MFGGYFLCGYLESISINTALSITIAIFATIIWAIPAKYICKLAFYIEEKSNDLIT